MRIDVIQVEQHWIGSCFHFWIDYNWAAFSKELLEWVTHFQDFGERKSGPAGK